MFVSTESHQVPLLIYQWKMQIYSYQPEVLDKKTDTEYTKHKFWQSAAFWIQICHRVLARDVRVGRRWTVEVSVVDSFEFH